MRSDDASALAASELIADVDRLIDSIRVHPSVVVAFSGGVDSAVVAAAAYIALGSGAVAATGTGSAVSDRDREDAQSVAAQIGIRHVWLNTNEVRDANYRANDGRRCYYCKSHLYAELHRWALQNGISTILSGTNLDDLGDYRPGLEAAKENHVVSPLAELGFRKERVRALAKYFGLSISSKPASPCLASRIAYGEEVSPERLRAIESAEAFLRTFPISDVRVRWYPGAIAKIEVPRDELHLFAEKERFEQVSLMLRSLGFSEVLLEPEGLKSGRLNKLLPILDS